MRSLFRVFVFGALAAGVTAAGWLVWSRRPHAVLERAARALAQGDFEACRTALDRAAGRVAAAEVAMLEARLARKQVDYGRMHTLLDTAGRSGAAAERIRLEEALAAADCGQLVEAERYLLERLRSDDEERAEICDSLSTGLARHGRLDEAAMLLDAWQADAPEDPRPYVKRGRFAEHALDWALAEAQYREALGKTPGNIVALASLGRVLAGRNEPVAARRCFEEVVERSTEAAPAARESIAACLVVEGRPDEARRLLHELLALDPVVRTRAYERTGHRPDGDVAARQLGKLELDDGHIDDAERWLARAVQANPRDLEARYALAQAWRRLGRDAEAEAEFEAVATARRELAEVDRWWDTLGKNPDDLEARYRIGVAFLRHRSDGEGIYWLRSVIARDPAHNAAHAALAEHFAASAATSETSRNLAHYHRERATAAGGAIPERRAADDGP